jgi:glycosyltransferase involved in cell wall biosynthesis
VNVTILFLAYNQQDFVVEAAESCLNQLGEPLEIILSDDCSNDDTFVILQKIACSYSGPHQVIVRQNSRNLGIADHYNTLVELAQGRLLITAAGDDISYPERAQTLYKAWQESGCKLDLIASHARCIKLDGEATGKTSRLTNSPTGKTQLIGALNALMWLAPPMPLPNAFGQSLAPLLQTYPTKTKSLPCVRCVLAVLKH